MMGSSRDNKSGVEMQDYMINWNVGPLGLVLRPDLGADMPPVVSQVLPGESVASLAGVSVGDILVSVNGKKASKLGYEKAMKLLYKARLPILLHFRIPQFKTIPEKYYNTNGSVTMAPTSTRHNSNASSNPYKASSFTAAAPSPHRAYPGQFAQYSQQQYQQQQQQQQYQAYPDQQYQQFHQSQRIPPPPSIANGGTRGGRSYSVLSSTTATKEQKLKKQFSVVWESGSLGFSFRPYAPGVNIPTVDLIGARGQGKSMDQVCVNDVLIAINGENTKSMGVERVLKMLHVLEKPVVLRFHKSSQRIENPPTPSTRARRKSSVKLPAVVENDQDEGQDQQDEGATDGIGVIQPEDGLPSVRFVDQIQLRSEQSEDDVLAAPLPPPPSPASLPSTPEPAFKRYSTRVQEDSKTMDPTMTMPVANKFAARMASSAQTHSSPIKQEHHHHHHHHHRQGMSPSRTPETLPSAPPPVVAAPITMSQPTHMEHDAEVFPEPDDDPELIEEVDESKLPHVPITIVGSVPPKKASSSFVIPLEHAREIVAKSSGKPVEQCEFGGIPLPQIREGSVQARLLVTFAKACLAKQMQQLRAEGKEPLSKPLKKAATTSPPKTQTPPRTSSPHSSENRSSVANAGSTYVPSDASVFAGHSQGPGKPIFAEHSFHEEDETKEPEFASTALTKELLSSPIVSENGSDESQRARAGTAVSSTGTEPVRPSEDVRRLSELAVESNVVRMSTLTSHSVSSLQRLSEAEQSSNGGLSMSQLRISNDKLPAENNSFDRGQRSSNDKLSSNNSFERGMLRDLNTPPDNLSPLPKRMTDMISLDTLNVEEETKEEPILVPKVLVVPPPVAVVKPEQQEQQQQAMEPAVIAQDKAKETVGSSEEMKPVAVVDQQPVVDAQREAIEVRRKLSVPAAADHPVIRNLCVGSHDLELVMVGRDVDMILCKKEVVDEIQDILDSLEMELQFERHSHVGVGHGNIMDEPPVRCCSRCGKSGDIADLALDSERRALYCQNCWDVFFYHKNVSFSSSSRGLEPPEIDTPTDFDPFEYSLHDSMVNVADEFHPWRHLQFDEASSQRDSNLTQVSSITSHADEVWL